MSERKELPDAVYAAAGASEVALERLRRLPETATRTAEELRERFRATDGDLAGRLALVRESARSGVASLVAQAAVAQERAASGYRGLVARGERVVNDRFGLTTGQTEPPRKIEVEVGDIQRDRTAAQ